MSHTVWKFPIPFEEHTTIEMPSGAIPLTAAVQGSQGIQLWAEIPDTNADLVEKTFWLVGTGNVVPDLATRYVSTMQVGMFVFHLYESA